MPTRVGKRQPGKADRKPWIAARGCRQAARSSGRGSKARARFPDRAGTSSSRPMRLAHAQAPLSFGKRCVPSGARAAAALTRVTAAKSSGRRDAGTARRRARVPISAHRQARSHRPRPASGPSCPAKCFAAVSRICAAVEKWMKPSARSDRRAVIAALRSRPRAIGRG